MWWSISGLIFQLAAGVFLALPYIAPGKMEKVDEEWHRGRGKHWLFVITWAFVVILVLIIFGISSYSDSTNHDVWFIELFGVILGAALPIFVWMYFVQLRFGKLLQRLPKWVQRHKYAAGIRCEKFVSANRYVCIWALVGWLASSGAMYFIYKQSENLTSFPWLLIFMTVLVIGSFCFSTFILALLYLILNFAINLIGKVVKKPLWITILVIFVIGCILQIVGVAVRA